ncbi:MAG: hypothetical protein HY033_04890 [Ignavibacteriae bacterium]|nr:hypothetical protein [Ignavibacteria bacterium]MBI3364226.1 hypothetical protein [Ignavibacteriota bacterium]
MVRIQSLVVLLAIGMTIVFLGCTKDNPVNTPGQMNDEQALTQQVTSVDSVAEFSSSDEATIDDNGLRDPDYEGLAKEASIDIGSIRSVAGDSIYPVRWGRHIKWDQVVRDYNVVMLGDTGALVTIVKTMPGEFWVGLGYRGRDTVVIDTIIRKPFTEIVTRKVQFKRIARTDDPRRNWVPVAITLVQGKTQGTAGFSISSLSIFVQHIDGPLPVQSDITDPLNTWFQLGWRHGTIPIFDVGDSVKVRVTIMSGDDSNEVVVLRHGIAGTSLLRGRTRMRLVSVSGSAGNYTRVYERTFRAALPWRSIFAARLNAVVDVISRSSIYVDTAPFVNEFWGMPYIVAY